MDRMKALRIILLAVVLLMAFWLVGAQGTDQSVLDSLVEQSSAAHTNGDYRNAITLYQTLVDMGIQDSRIYFNLGSSYYQAGDTGRALLNLRRAQGVHPRDLEIFERVNFLRSIRFDVQGDELFFWDAVSNLTTGVMTERELGWLVLLLWFVIFGLWIVWLLAVNARSYLRLPLAGMLLLFSITLGLWLVRSYVTANRPSAVVVESTISVMSGPGDDYLQLYQLYSGAELRVLGRKEGWVHFVLPDQREGWAVETGIEKI